MKLKIKLTQFICVRRDNDNNQTTKCECIFDKFRWSIFIEKFRKEKKIPADNRFRNRLDHNWSPSITQRIDFFSFTLAITHQNCHQKWNINDYHRIHSTLDACSEKVCRILWFCRHIVILYCKILLLCRSTLYISIYIVILEEL